VTRKHGTVVAHPPVPPTVAAAAKAQSVPTKIGWRQAWIDFWFSPVSPAGLHALRVLAGLLFLVWLLPFAKDVESLFGLSGWFDREAYVQTSRLPTEAAMLLNWSLLYFTGPGLYWGALVVLVLFTIGVATRVTSVLTWLLVVSLTANPATRFDADDILGILAFYLMIGYVLVGQWSLPLSPVGRVFGTRTSLVVWKGLRADAEHPSYAANLAIRLMQVHFALIVVTSGLHKLQFGAWWSGTALWYPMNPPFSTTEGQLRSLAAIRERYLFFHSIIQYAALAWQLGFPLFAWRQGWMRLVLFGGAALGWLACWEIYKIPLFGPLYLIFCLAYLTPAEWARLLARLKLRRAVPATLAAGVVLFQSGCAPKDAAADKAPGAEQTVAHNLDKEPLAPLEEMVGNKRNVEGTPILQVRIDAALQEMRSRTLSFGHTFWTVFHEILGIGPESAYLQDSVTGKRVKALDYICDGGKLSGLKMVNIRPGRADVVTMPGSGTGQGHQDQFIAEMAQWGMPRDRKMIVDGKECTFESFIYYSKERATVRAKQELSWAIIIISEYYGTNVSWTNVPGETLHFEDVVRYEMHQEIKESPACGGTHRLFGLTWAYHRHLKEGGPMTDVWKELIELTRGYKELAHELQNKDGSFSTEFFRRPGNDQGDLKLRIYSSGHIFEWLALAMTDEELREPWMENAADALARMILDNRNQGLDGGAVYHATHGLEIYRNRVFGPTPHPPVIPLPPK
jgi:hypothetical protein